MRSEFFRIPIIDLPINGYGVMVLTGVLAGLWVLGRAARRRGLDPQMTYDIAVWMVLCGLVGGRVFYYVQSYEQFAGDPFGVFKIWEGGLVLYGAIAGGLLCLIVCLRRRRQRLLPFLDVGAPAMAVGLGFGRLGCFLHGCCWGKRCYEDFFLAVHFPHGSPPALDPITGGGVGGASLAVHPAQLYASANAFLMAWVLWCLVGRKNRPGTVIGVGAVIYGLSRFLLETIRGDHHPAPGFWPISQLISVGVLGMGLSLILWPRFSKGASIEAEVAAGPAKVPVSKS